MTDEKKAVVLRFLEALDRHDVESLKEHPARSRARRQHARMVEISVRGDAICTAWCIPAAYRSPDSAADAGNRGWRGRVGIHGPRRALAATAPVLPAGSTRIGKHGNGRVLQAVPPRAGAGG